MAGKKNTEKEGSSWVGGIEKYSRKIWLAGLGIYSKIDEDGSKLFDSLVKDGEKAEKQAKNAAESAKDTARAGTSRVSEVKERALGKWGELEEAFDKRLNSAISRLGVPSRNEIKALHQQVDTLTKQIERLTGASVKPVSSRSVAASKATATRSTAKPLAKAVTKPAEKAVSAAKSATTKAAAKTAAAKPAAAKKPAAPRKPAVKKAPAKSEAPASSAASSGNSGSNSASSSAPASESAGQASQA
ncbi:MAG TPA: phasin family protein [Pseudomonas sp.]|uniref:phasin family protein n=1 Tax=Pseudomonas sp. TaxID=306 RepID=UPI002B46A485|nr:phasin family protein [Pseudomonas sp.]HKS14758.1 phasin family protein [Pseudomonas sp.]